MSLPKTAREVIARSIAMHPTLYREAVDSMAMQHHTHARSTYNELAAKAALNMAQDCDAVAANIDAEDVDTIVAELAQRIPAVTIAARLQCLPRWMVADLVENVGQ